MTSNLLQHEILLARFAILTLKHLKHRKYILNTNNLPDFAYQDTGHGKIGHENVRLIIAQAYCLSEFPSFRFQDEPH